MDSTIYGIEYQTRTLCPQYTDDESTGFFVGTQTPRAENQVHLVKYDDEEASLQLCWRDQARVRCRQMGRLDSRNMNTWAAPLTSFALGLPPGTRTLYLPRIRYDVDEMSMNETKSIMDAITLAESTRVLEV